MPKVFFWGLFIISVGSGIGLFGAYGGFSSDDFMKSNLLGKQITGLSIAIGIPISLIVISCLMNRYRNSRTANSSFRIDENKNELLLDSSDIQIQQEQKARLSISDEMANNNSSMNKTASSNNYNPLLFQVDQSSKSSKANTINITAHMNKRSFSNLTLPIASSFYDKPKQEQLMIAMKYAHYYINKLTSAKTKQRCLLNTASDWEAHDNRYKSAPDKQYQNIILKSSIEKMKKDICKEGEAGNTAETFEYGCHDIAIAYLNNGFGQIIESYAANLRAWATIVKLVGDVDNKSRLENYTDNIKEELCNPINGINENIYEELLDDPLLNDHILNSNNRNWYQH